MTVAGVKSGVNASAWVWLGLRDARVKPEIRWDSLRAGSLLRLKNGRSGRQALLGNRPLHHYLDEPYDWTDPRKTLEPAK
jgi:hypothetical protein